MVEFKCAGFSQTDGRARFELIPTEPGEHAVVVEVTIRPGTKSGGECVLKGPVEEAIRSGKPAEDIGLCGKCGNWIYYRIREMELAE